MNLESETKIGGNKVSKVVLIVLLLICCVLPGCKSEAHMQSSVSQTDVVSDSSEGASVAQENLDYISLSIKNAMELYDCSIYATDNNNCVDVHFSMEGGMTDWIFADCVYNVTKSARQAIDSCEEDLGEITISFNIINPNKENDVMTWTSSDYDNGMLIDLRGNGKNDFLKKITIEEMMKRYDYQASE